MSAFFPTVPNFPGVPPVMRTVLRFANAATLLIADAQFLGRQKPVWAILNSNGTPALKPDNFLEWGIEGQSVLPTFPIEDGGFRNYNKVNLPAVVRMRVTKGGNVRQRASFINQVWGLRRSRELLTLVWPEGWIRNRWNLERYSITRTQDEGVTLITFELYFKDVVLAPVTGFQKTVAPSGASAVAGGQTQAVPGDPIEATIPATVLPAPTTGAVQTLGAQTLSFANSAVSVAGQMLQYGGPLLTIGTLLAATGGNLSRTLASPLALATISAVGLPFILQNAGWAVASMGKLASDGVSALASLGSEVASASLLPQLGALTTSSAALSASLLNSSEIVSTGGTLAAYTFNSPGVSSLTSPAASSGSSLAQMLDTVQGPVRSGNVTYGPILPSQAQ